MGSLFGSGEGSLLTQLLEIRRRLIRVLVVFLVILIPAVIFSKLLFRWLALPMLAKLPVGASLIATGVASPFLVPFKLAFAVALFATVPYLLYEGWTFIAPGLYRRERSLLFPLLVASLALFYSGMAFAYFLIMPLAFGFFTSMAPSGVRVMTDINSYLNFVMTLFFAFGFAFELPVAQVLLVWTGIISIEKMRRWRPYVLVGVFVVGMLLTPPDMFSQTLLAVPLYLLYESGIWFSHWLIREARRSPGEIIT